MDTDFLSGLLLLAVVAAGAGYLIKEFFWESIIGLLAEHRPSPPAGASDHLIGAVGRIVDDGQRTGKLRVRAGMEIWPAKLTEVGEPLPVGAEVEIKAVHGNLLEVTERRVESNTAAEGSKSAPS